MIDRKNMHMMSVVRGAVIGFAALAVSGCISLSAEPPASLLTLTATATAPAGSGSAGTNATAIKVLEPETPARLAVPRIPVQVNPTKIAYLKDAVWVEPPARLFRRLVAETLRTRTNALVVDGDDPGVGAATTLRGTLRQFGYDAASMSAIVRYDAIYRDAEGNLQTRRFESVQSGVNAAAGPVGKALNRAANDVAGQVVDWFEEE